MSALPPKADIGTRLQNVRYADIVARLTGQKKKAPAAPVLAKAFSLGCKRGGVALEYT